MKLKFTTYVQKKKKNPVYNYQENEKLDKKIYINNIFLEQIEFPKNGTLRK